MKAWRKPPESKIRGNTIGEKNIMQTSEKETALTKAISIWLNMPQGTPEYERAKVRILKDKFPEICHEPATKGLNSKQNKEETTC